MTAAQVYDSTRCQLGEGPLWHPEQKRLYWFDILSSRLYCRDGDELEQWDFDEHVSAAGWMGGTRLLVASETALAVFETKTGQSEFLCALEADNPVTRSNDGRADPWGGFWIGTMGKAAEPGAGAIYRFYRGELRKLFANITVSNAISFPPDAGFACFTDTRSRVVQSVALDEATGWPKDDPEPYLDLNPRGRNPDGAVFGADGTLWVAEWGASGVTGYDAAGTEVAAFNAPASQVSCPAFGGADLCTLFGTSAIQGLDPDQEPAAGQTFAWDTEFVGQAEHRVIL